MFNLTLKGPYLAYNEDYLLQANRFKQSSLGVITSMSKIAMLKPALFNCVCMGIFPVSIARNTWPTLIAGEGPLAYINHRSGGASGVWWTENKWVAWRCYKRSFPIMVFLLSADHPNAPLERHGDSHPKNGFKKALTKKDKTCSAWMHFLCHQMANQLIQNFKLRIALTSRLVYLGPKRHENPVCWIF